MGVTQAWSRETDANGVSYEKQVTRTQMPENITDLIPKNCGGDQSEGRMYDTDWLHLVLGVGESPEICAQTG